MESAYQFSSRPDCNNTAEVPSFSLRTALSAIPIRFWSVWCRRTMIPGRIFTGFAKFQGICQCKMTLGFHIWLQELLQAPLCFLRSFGFCTHTTGSIGLPSPAPRLHIDDCFEIHIYHWELCDLLLSSHQKFLHEVRLRQRVFCTEPSLFWSL